MQTFWKTRYTPQVMIRSKKGKENGETIGKSTWTLTSLFRASLRRFRESRTLPSVNRIKCLNFIYRYVGIQFCLGGGDIQLGREESKISVTRLTDEENVHQQSPRES